MKIKIFFRDLKRSGYNYRIFMMRREARKNKIKEMEKLLIRLSLIQSKMATGEITFSDAIAHDMVAMQLHLVRAQPLPSKHTGKGFIVEPLQKVKDQLT
jgi:hypothetical protein